MDSEMTHQIKVKTRGRTNHGYKLFAIISCASMGQQDSVTGF